MNTGSRHTPVPVGGYVRGVTCPGAIMCGMTVSAQRRARPPRLKQRLLAGGFVAAALLVLALAYVRVGWWRMETACTAEPPGGRPVSSVAFGWSWTPPGFICTYGDGRTETSLWF